MTDKKPNLFEQVVGYSEKKTNSDIAWDHFYAVGSKADASSERLKQRFALEDIHDYTEETVTVKPYFDEYGAKFGTTWTVMATATPPKEAPIDYLFDEDKHIQAAFDHIKATYGSHYGGETQPTELIIDSGNGVGFTVGNIIKYAARLGKKDGWNVKDIYKIIHYAVMLAYIVEKDKAAS